MVYTASGDEFEIAEEEVHLYTEDQLIAKYGKIYEQADWKERFKDTVQRKFSCSGSDVFFLHFNNTDKTMDHNGKKTSIG